MSARSARRLAWLQFGLSLAATAVGLLLLFVTLRVEVPAGWGFRGFTSIFALAFSSTGALVVMRRPNNAVGWLLGAIGLLAALQVACEGYAVLALIARPSQFAGGEVAVWFLTWMWLPYLVLIGVYLPVLFPHGHLPSRRWRPVALVAAIATCVACAAIAFWPGEVVDVPFARNPLGVQGAEAPLRMALAIAGAVLLACVAAAGINLVLRVRKARGEERQQLKWFASAIALVGVAIPLGSHDQSFGFKLGELALVAAIATVPVATSVAILRYHLYDIDLIIRRTLVYAVLTSGLGAVYWASVVVLQQLLRPFTSGSDLTIIASTLAVVALFQPLRTRIQAAVDRRFYRNRYDAARTLETFSSRLRDEIDLDTLRAELLQVVRRTMQPTESGLWLRSIPQGSSETRR